jgi:autotransporter-associated beta strand protein
VDITGLAWNLNENAHGTFNVANEFTVYTDLADSTQTDTGKHFKGWDGQSLTKTGAGVLTLAETNGYTGDTTVTQGTLSIGSDGNIGNGPNTLDDSTLRLTGEGTYSKVWTLEDKLGNAIEVTAGGDGATFATNALIGGGGFTKTGEGILTLAGENSYTGHTTIRTGTLSIEADDRIGDGTNTLDGGALRLTGANYAKEWTLGKYTATTDATLGSIDVTVTTGNIIEVLDGNNATLATATLTGEGGFTKKGGGILTLSGTNDYQGDTAIWGGLINFSAADNFGTGWIILNGGTLQWEENTADLSARLAPLGINGGIFDTHSNNVSLASNLTGTGGLTKTGEGVLTLSGTNIYVGGTTIREGTLSIAASNNIGTPNASVLRHLKDVI